MDDNNDNLNEDHVMSDALDDEEDELDGGDDTHPEKKASKFDDENLESLDDLEDEELDADEESYDDVDEM